MKNKIIEIKSFDDFLSKFKMFLFCYNKIQPTFCLEESHMYHYNFTEGYSEKQLNQDIIKNSDMFNWKKTTSFYYPNTNMFSGDNSVYNISGYEVKLKERKKRDNR